MWHWHFLMVTVWQWRLQRVSTSSTWSLYSREGVSSSTSYWFAPSVQCQQNQKGKQCLVLLWKRFIPHDPPERVLWASGVCGTHFENHWLRFIKCVYMLGIFLWFKCIKLFSSVNNSLYPWGPWGPGATFPSSHRWDATETHSGFSS